MSERGKGTNKAQKGTLSPPGGESNFVASLRRGDEAAFAWLLDAYHTSFVRLARLYVSSDAVAEEVVQETWLAILTGLSSFEERSSLRTWLYRIVINRAKTRADREGRSVPFSSFAEEGEAAVDPQRFDSFGRWSAPPQPWDGDTPEKRLHSKEVQAKLSQLIEELPPHYRSVVLLRDVEGCSSEEACSILGLSEANQRVLLHRARSRLRAALEKYLKE